MVPIYRVTESKEVTIRPLRGKRVHSVPFCGEKRLYAFAACSSAPHPASVLAGWTGGCRPGAGNQGASLRSLAPCARPCGLPGEPRCAWGLCACFLGPCLPRITEQLSDCLPHRVWSREALHKLLN